MGATERTLTCPECGSPCLRGVKFCAECGTPLSGIELDIGTSVGNYRLLELLGEGGMGRVYIAEHLKLGRRVAIKKLRGELVSNPSAVARFFAEARAVNRISHENIVEITDFFEQPGGDNYIVMELLKGEDLAHRLQRRRALALPRAFDIAAQTASALAAVHAAGMIHRDLKPDNIYLIERGGSADFVKVLDFGVAKLTDGADRRDLDVHVTAAGQIIGTPEYMSPEQAGGRAIDARTDIYALGVILYEMIVGELPFRARSFGELLIQHMTAPIELPGPAPGLPHDLNVARDQLLLDLLAKEPAGRPRTMRDVEARLRSLIDAMELSKSTKKRLALADSQSSQVGASTGAVARVALVKRLTPPVVEITTPRSVSRIEVPTGSSRTSGAMAAMSPHPTPVEDLPPTGRFARSSTDCPCDAPELAGDAVSRQPRRATGSSAAIELVEGGPGPEGATTRMRVPRVTRKLAAAALLELEEPPDEDAEPELELPARNGVIADRGLPPGGSAAEGRRGLIEDSLAIATDAIPAEVLAALARSDATPRGATSRRLQARTTLDAEPAPTRPRRILASLGVLVAAIVVALGVNEVTRDLEPEASAPVAAPTGEIKIKFVSAPPGAVVRLAGEGEPLGTTPFTLSFPRSPRAVLFEVAKPGYVPISEVLTLTADDAIAVMLTPLAVPPPPPLPDPPVAATPPPPARPDRRRPAAKPVSPDRTLDRNGTLDVFKK